MFRPMCLCHCRLCKPGYYRRNDQPFLHSPHQKDFCSGRSCTGIHCAEFSHCRRSPDCRSVPGIPAQCRSRRMAVDPGADAGCDPYLFLAVCLYRSHFQQPGRRQQLIYSGDRSALFKLRICASGCHAGTSGGFCPVSAYDPCDRDHAQRISGYAPGYRNCHDLPALVHRTYRCFLFLLSCVFLETDQPIIEFLKSW